MSRERLVEVTLLKAFAISLMTLLITVVPFTIMLIVEKPEEWIAVLTIIWSIIEWMALMACAIWKFCFKEITPEGNDEE